MEVVFALGGDHRYRDRNRSRLLQIHTTDCDPDTDPDGYILFVFLFDTAKSQHSYELISNSFFDPISAASALSFCFLLHPGKQ
jgi:hypothetical protein